MYRFGVFIAVAIGALIASASAFAHAEISPAVGLSGTGQLFTLAVPTEKEGLTTTKVELRPPSGFSIDSFVPSPGWQRNVQTSGSGDEAAISSITWSGGSVPHDEDAIFQFIASGDSAMSYAFQVRQTYSDGTVVDWSGPESSDTPAPVVELKSSLGGGGSDTLAIVAIALAGIALLVSVLGLFSRSGKRTLA